MDPEGVLTRWNESERDGGSIGSAMQMLGLKPSAETRVENLRLSLPEVRVQPTLDLQMIQLQFNDSDGLREIAPDVGNPDVETGDAATLGVCFDHHTYLLFNSG